MKSCAACGYWKSDREFYVCRRPGRSRDGMNHDCKDCAREKARESMRKSYYANRKAA